MTELEAMEHAAVRLECLKLAMARAGADVRAPAEIAEEYYRWVIAKPAKAPACARRERA